MRSEPLGLKVTGPPRCWGSAVRVIQSFRWPGSVLSEMAIAPKAFRPKMEHLLRMQLAYDLPVPTRKRRPFTSSGTHRCRHGDHDNVRRRYGEGTPSIPTRGRFAPLWSDGGGRGACSAFQLWWSRLASRFLPLTAGGPPSVMGTRSHMPVTRHPGRAWRGRPSPGGHGSPAECAGRSALRRRSGCTSGPWRVYEPL